MSWRARVLCAVLALALVRLSTASGAAAATATSSAFGCADSNKNAWGSICCRNDCGGQMGCGQCGASSTCADGTPMPACEGEGVAAPTTAHGAPATVPLVGAPLGGGDGAAVNCCGGGSGCGYQHCPALGAGSEGCVQPFNMPNNSMGHTMDFEKDCVRTHTHTHTQLSGTKHGVHSGGTTHFLGSGGPTTPPSPSPSTSLPPLVARALKFRVVTNCTCASIGYAPIVEKETCDWAATSLRLGSRQSRPSNMHGQHVPRPEGCYLNVIGPTKSLWLNIAAENKGHGGSASYQQVCQIASCHDEYPTNLCKLYTEEGHCGKVNEESVGRLCAKTCLHCVETKPGEVPPPTAAHLKFHMISNGTCASKGLAAITDQSTCNWAASKLHIPLDQRVSHITLASPRPEGCYYDGKLWLNPASANRGEGAVKNHRPICQIKSCHDEYPREKCASFKTRGNCGSKGDGGVGDLCASTCGHCTVTPPPTLAASETKRKFKLVANGTCRDAGYTPILDQVACDWAAGHVGIPVGSRHSNATSAYPRPEGCYYNGPPPGGLWMDTSKHNIGIGAHGRHMQLCQTRGCHDEYSAELCLAYKGMGSCDMLGSSDDILKKIFVQLLCPKTCGACTVNERCRAPGGQGCAWTVTTVFKGAVSHNEYARLMHVPAADVTIAQTVRSKIVVPVPVPVNNTSGLNITHTRQQLRAALRSALGTETDAHVELHEETTRRALYATAVHTIVPGEGAHTPARARAGRASVRYAVTMRADVSLLGSVQPDTLRHQLAASLQADPKKLLVSAPDITTEVQLRVRDASTLDRTTTPAVIKAALQAAGLRAVALAQVTSSLLVQRDVASGQALAADPSATTSSVEHPPTGAPRPASELPSPGTTTLPRNSDGAPGSGAAAGSATGERTRSALLYFALGLGAGLLVCVGHLICRRATRKKPAYSVVQDDDDSEMESMTGM